MMSTRKGAKQKHCQTPEKTNEKSEDDTLDNTMVEVDETDQDKVKGTVPSDQLASLLASIDALNKSIISLHKDNQNIRGEIQRISASAAATPVSPTNNLATGTVTSTNAPTQQNSMPYCQEFQPSQNLASSCPVAGSITTTSAVPSIKMPPQQQSTPITMGITSFMPPNTNVQPSLQNPQESIGISTLQPSFTTQHTSSFVDHGAARLYPLPSFDGNPEDWPLFKASFMDTTSEFGYTNRQNLMRLQRSLHGRAKEAVTSMLIFPDNVPQVLEELEFNFGRPELMIHIQMQKIQQFPAIHENRTEQIVDFSNQVRNVVAFLKSANCERHLLNPLLLEQLVLKLPASKQYEWSRHIMGFSQTTNIEIFAQWLSDLARVVSLMPTALITSQRNNQPASPRLRTVTQQSSRQTTSSASAHRRVLHNNVSSYPSTSEQQVACINCKQAHKLSVCRSFKARNTRSRWQLVKNHHLCFSCLQQGHSLSQCPNKRTCRIEGCHRMHHTLLHLPITPNNQTSSPVEQVTAVSTTESSNTSPAQNKNEHLLNCYNDASNSCLFKILPVVLSGPQGSMTVYAMYDEGSSVTLLEEQVANDLGVTGQVVPLTLQWFNDKQTTEQSRKVNLEIKGRNSNVSHQLKNVYTVRHLDLPTQTFKREQYHHFHNLPIDDYSNIKPCLLIGLDNSHLCTAKVTITARSHEPIATSTSLGWVAYGPSQSANSITGKVFHVRQSPTVQHLHKLVAEYFAVDSLGVKYIDTLESAHNVRAKEILQKTTANIGQRYEVGLLWRTDNIQLPPNYDMAKNRLLNVERKMSNDSRYAASYRNEIQKYIDKGYAQLLNEEEASSHGPTTWYLPHFGVVNPNKPLKLRIVFDAAATVSNTSLNSMLLVGPECAQPLLNIMYKFRQRQVAVAGDIQEMFLQIKIRQADQNAQRFLWRNGDTSRPIQTYVMTSMIFGASCSPCCAEYVKNMNALRFQSTMPKGVRAITENTYVDDLVTSFDDAEEARAVINEAVAINAAAGFHLRNFVSNHKGLQNELNKNVPTSEVISMEHQPKTDKILGMYWNSNQDVLEFHFKFAKVPKDVLNCKRTPTKRELLGLAMSIYDPFGLLANVTIGVKIILQATWKEQSDWDDPLPEKLETPWLKWWSAFQSVKDFSVPRCYSPLYSTATNLQLHIFVDASDAAYAAVAYLRLQQNDDINVAFVAAKSRCAPKREMSVPRLELQAALLGSRLRTAIESCIDKEINKVTFWSDSKTVLHWLRSTKRNYKQFVASRVGEILNCTSLQQWRWLPSALNVADAATKVKASPIFNSDSQWIKGPAFLYEDVENWPMEPSELTSENCGAEECKKKIFLISKGQFIIDFKRYSSFTRLLRVTAWSLRFINNLKPELRRHEELTAKELSAAEDLIIRQVQSEVYKDDINALKISKDLPTNSQLKQLTPKLDQQGVLRINGRIDAAYCLPYTARHPVILPREHHVSKLIMDYYHRKNHHQNSKLVINEMRQRYWIPRSHSLLNVVKRNCPVCVRNKTKPAVPLMGQLPTDRLTPFIRPFTYTGVDYCGPFSVTIGRRREKRWIALFTCLTTRAIHLEVSTDLSTDSFIICLRNFVNRRGVPIRIRSDNGTNFIGAQSQLKMEDRLLDIGAIQREASTKRIEWLFNCPANPSSGGCWERLVQCVKRILQRVLKEEAPRLDTFCSVLIEAENIVNSRPLTDIPLSPDSPEPLTPNHFLIGCLNSTQTPGPANEKVCLRKQWRIAQNLKDRFWKQWINEYLPQLLTRPKWHREVEPLQKDQLVIVCDASLPRSQWQVGRIVDVITAKDGQVRSANVKTSQGIIRRPASKLAALEIANP